MQLYIIDYHLRNSSGLSTYVSQLTAGLAQAKNISLNYIGVNAKMENEVEKRQIDDSVHLLYPDELNIVNQALNDQLISMLKTELIPENPVVFHFNWINHAPFARLLKQKFECIAILTKHCIPWRDHVTNNYELFSKLNKILQSHSDSHFLHPSFQKEYISYTAVDHIICVTEFAKENLYKIFNLQKNKVSVIYNGFKKNTSQARSKKDLRKEWGFSQSEKIILYAGNIHVRKGIIGLVESFGEVLKKYPNSRLVIAGQGDFHSILSEATKIWSKITLTGNLHKSLLNDLYCLADIGVVPSFVEQCSYTAIEMMHSGLPIVVSDIDGLTEIVKTENGIKIPILMEEGQAKVDIIGLSNGILRLIENPKYALSLAKKSKAFAEVNLNSELMVSKTIRVYKDLIKKQKKAKYGSKNFSSMDITVCLCFKGTIESYKNVINNILESKYVKFNIALILSEADYIEYSTVLNRAFIDLKYIIVPKKQSIAKVLNHYIKSLDKCYISIITKYCLVDCERFIKQIDFLSNTPSADFVGSNSIILDNIGNTIGVTQFSENTIDCKVLSYFQPIHEISNLLFKISSLKKVKLKSFDSRIDELKLSFDILERLKGINTRELLTSIFIDPLKEFKERKFRLHSAHILENKLEKANIEFDIKEFSVHLAIYFGYKKQFFNNKAKIHRLDTWLIKILPILQGSNDYHHLNLKTYVMENLCGINY